MNRIDTIIILLLIKFLFDCYVKFQAAVHWTLLKEFLFSYALGEKIPWQSIFG